MIRVLRAAGAAVLLSAGTAASAERWTTDAAQGITEYRIDNAAGDEFTVSCDIEASKGGDGTAILLMLGGKDPTPNTKVKLVLDAETFLLPINQAGMVGTDCKSCSDSFKAIWAKLREASSMRVQYGDGPASTFSLEGAKVVLPAQPCRTGFDG